MPACGEDYNRKPTPCVPSPVFLYSLLEGQNTFMKSPADDRQVARFSGVFILVFVALAASTCARGPAGRLAEPPRFETTGAMSKCLAAGLEEPLVVEWPSNFRGKLEAQAKKSAIAVHLEGCALQILPECRVRAAYQYSAFTRKRDRVHIKNSQDLWANVPLSAASLEGKLASSGELNVNLITVGRWESEHRTISHADLEGNCAGATHLIAAMSVGAFEFYAGAQVDVGGGAKAFGTGAGARDAATRETINEDGDPKACEQAKANDAAPPFQCGSILRLELTAVQPTPDHAVPLPAEETLRGGCGLTVKFSRISAQRTLLGEVMFNFDKHDVVKATEMQTGLMPDEIWEFAAHLFARRRYDDLEAWLSFRRQRIRAERDEVEREIAKGQAVDAAQQELRLRRDRVYNEERQADWMTFCALHDDKKDTAVKQAAEEFLRKYPNNAGYTPDVMYLLGRIYAREDGGPPKARALFAQILADYPMHRLKLDVEKALRDLPP